MAARCVTDAYYPPQYSKRFTSFAAQLVLHGAAAPPDTQHLPCQVVVETTAANQHLDYIDSAGALVAMNFLTPGLYGFRMAPTSLETTTTVTAATVFWSQKG